MDALDQFVLGVRLQVQQMMPRFAGTLLLASFAGSNAQYVVRLDGGLEITAEARIGREAALPPAGTRLEVAVAPSDVLVMVPQ